MYLCAAKAVRGAPLWLQVGLGRYLQKFRMHYKKDVWLACFGGKAFDEPIRAGSTASMRTPTPRPTSRPEEPSSTTRSTTTSSTAK